uniref:amidohydrolase n=1 Tax=Flavobacterium sp. TaxID=239 RepID=UPI0040492B05
MQISIIQAPLTWENPASNRSFFQQQFGLIPENTDLVVLPEMFTSGFTMQPQNVAETMQGETIEWLKMQSEKFDFAIIGSLVVVEDGNYFNRLVFVKPDGKIQTYDKRHLFTLAGESKVYKAGDEKLIIDYKGWRICPLVCYDLRFPIFARNTDNYDILIFVANWPKPRINAWDVLLQARAIENMSYVVGVNRVGEDASGHQYIGHSQIVDFMGKNMVSAENKAGIFTSILSKEDLENARSRFKFLDDRDVFRLV